jgi:hypothetical protein
MKKLRNTFLCTALIVAPLAIATPAQAGETLEEAFKEGTPYVDARYRYETVDQDGIADKAHASTLRTRLGYKSGVYKDFSGTLEFENVTQIGSDNYNDTLNGNTTRPVVADVESTEVNQAFLQFAGVPDTNIKVGRQVITLDGHRFVGHVGWRQNNQTFDAIAATNTSIEDTTATYGYINNVNRIFGDDSAAGNFDSNSHLINVSNTSLPIGKLVGYGYFLDFEMDAPGLSSKTYGASLTGKQALNEDVTFKYHVEYAMQSDHGDNTTSYDASYYHIAPALAWKGFTATVGYEVLGSDDGVAGFATPLATGHKFNGWADKFLGTPANGLEDIYIDLTYKFKDLSGDMEFFNGLLVKGQYHDFSADNGGADYGSEFGLFATLPIEDHYYIEVKYADYNADSFATDTQKLTLGLGVKF